MVVKIKFLLKKNKVSLSCPLLQQGFQVSAKVGCGIQSFLCDQFGMMPDYLSDRINTIFLNGKPVDDVASAILNDGDTLALSASMPGLVGATFRKSGCLAAFRGSITYRAAADPPAACQDGTVTLKLFNLLVHEIGPLFLEHGIWTQGSDLHDLLETYRPDIGENVVKVEKDGQEIDRQMLSDPDWITPDARAFLRFMWET